MEHIQKEKYHIENFTFSMWDLCDFDKIRPHAVWGKKYY